MKILMVCLGNICRSPMAEGILRSKIAAQGLDWTVDSAGTNRYHTGEPPHKHSVKTCRLNGIDISEQRARTFVAADFERYDRIYALAKDVYDDIIKIAGSKADLNKLEYLLNEHEPGSNGSVTDPWYGDESGYLPVFRQIEACCEAIIKNHR